MILPGFQKAFFFSKQEKRDKMKIFSASRFVNKVDTAIVLLQPYAYGFSSHRSPSAFRTLNKLSHCLLPLVMLLMYLSIQVIPKNCIFKRGHAVVWSSNLFHLELMFTKWVPFTIISGFIVYRSIKQNR